MNEEDEAFEELSRKQGDWGMQGSRKHQIMRYAENVESKGTSMTEKETMKLALEALETLMLERGSIYEQAITALKGRLAQDKALQALHDENERLGLYEDAYAEQEQEPVASSLVECVMSARKEFSAIKGESQFCTECHAFERADSWWQEWHGGDIDYIIGAKYTHPPQRTEQEPVALHCCGYTDASAVKWNPLNGVVQCHNCGQTYTPPQRTEQNFCSRCGKRTPDLITIHTCTPPKENT